MSGILFLVCMLTLYLIFWSISTTFGHNYDFNILYINPFSEMIHVSKKSYKYCQHCTRHHVPFTLFLGWYICRFGVCMCDSDPLFYFVVCVCVYNCCLRARIVTCTSLDNIFWLDSFLFVLKKLNWRYICFFSQWLIHSPLLRITLFSIG
jgi:hypothetical protein